ncbi:hypothetical protein SAMN02746065_11036 [Desulfocicer vacuolatum DSM 3385]|uniref:Uncharacterized protein n=1 Tax=Desulfocicer vacuolatum DSM 3385 TaxID=1121400 RepID=A0A1W2BZT9_9BACT|nr:hypothetical protein [Desulfocicer vacuolatum]SMC78517.1 hypothetical protein SAMN02746065_11036 [Desulfocicer vacuolatum DSM 3385]
MPEEKSSFKDYFLRRKDADKTGYYATPAIRKAYYIGAYSKAVINSSFYSRVSRENTTFKNWLSNQIINYRNLERIFEIAFRYEQKLKLNIRNQSEVRKLAHETPVDKAAGMSSAKISFAFVAGFDDYGKYSKEEQKKSVEKETKE